MHFLRSAVSFVILLCLLVETGFSQSKKPNPDEGYNPVVAPENKKKKKAEETQVLALPPELPTAVVAETDRLTFQVTPLSAKGLLSQQTRDALKGLLHSNRGPIVKLRAFVAGSGDLRRIGEIAAEMFSEKRMPLPALTVVQVGALPLEGAQVVIEATETDRKTMNPSGVFFFAAEPGSTVAESLAKLKSDFAASKIEPSDALIVTCFLSSLDEQRNTQQLISQAFPGAALDYVQMQRAPVKPDAACEATARASKQGLSDAPRVSWVSPHQIVLTGTQLAFGNKETDFKLAFDRLEKALAAKGARLNQSVLVHLYVTAAQPAPNVLALEPAGVPSSVFPVEALPSLDSPLGLDVIAVPSP